MSRRHLKLELPLAPQVFERSADIRITTVADRQPPADLLLAADAGTIDDEGETPA